MDNVLSGVDSDRAAFDFYSEAKEMFKDASMNLREWASNNESYTENIPDNDRAKEEDMKVLGMMWDRNNDSLSLRDAKLVETNSVIKRSVLKDVASVFDPLGLFSLVTLNGKLLLQNLWIKHCEWDEEIDSEDLFNWNEVRNDLKLISDQRLDRFVVFKKQDDVKNILVCFCDASAKAYAACVYLVQQSVSDNRSDLIFSKTRLAASGKTTTIPRLELMEAVIAVRCINFVRKQIKKKYLQYIC